MLKIILFCAIIVTVAHAASVGSSSSADLDKNLEEDRAYKAKKPKITIEQQIVEHQKEIIKLQEEVQKKQEKLASFLTEKFGEKVEVTTTPAPPPPPPVIVKKKKKPSKPLTEFHKNNKIHIVDGNIISANNGKPVEQQLAALQQLFANRMDGHIIITKDDENAEEEDEENNNDDDEDEDESTPSPILVSNKKKPAVVTSNSGSSNKKKPVPKPANQLSDDSKKEIENLKKQLEAALQKLNAEKKSTTKKPAVRDSNSVPETYVFSSSKTSSSSNIDGKEQKRESYVEKHADGNGNEYIFEDHKKNGIATNSYVAPNTPVVSTSNTDGGITLSQGSHQEVNSKPQVYSSTQIKKGDQKIYKDGQWITV